jgi:uncharacterized protein
MPTGLETAPTEAPEFAGRIRLPYTLTAGRTAGIFLAELANRRIVGSRTPGGRVLVPAQDFDGETGEETEATLLELPSTGRITAFTETAAGVLALVRIDGADTDMVHQILDADHASLQIGQRVTARWADEPQGSMLDLAGFVLAADEGDPAPAAPRELATDTEPIAQTPYELDLRYRHAYGPYYGRMFDELATSRRILGVRCPSCENVLVPPREFCELCFVRTGEWVDVADTGVLQAYSVIHLEFVGQTREPPYIYAEVILDGASTRLIHMIGGIDPEEAPKRLAPGARVRAVWREDATTGTLEDIEHFVLMEDR